MKKQTYIQPAVEVVELEVSSVLCGSILSDMTDANANAENNVECYSSGNRWGSMFDPSSEEE